MKSPRLIAVSALVLAALILQVSVLPHLSWRGIGPDLCLLVVVGAALARGPQFAMGTGFVAGLLLDLAPPADHVAGRWALALVLVGFVAGFTRTQGQPVLSSVAATTATASFVGTSVFALSGMVLGELPTGIPDLLLVVAVSLVWDVLLGLLVVPAVWRVLVSAEPARLAA